MINVMFVCHGNICRSPMAEFVFKKLIADRGLSDDFLVKSCATSSEELGNPIYPPARRELLHRGIPFSERCAVRLCKDDYSKYNLFIAMDDNNVRNIMRIFGSDPDNKVKKLMYFTERSGDVADPWYTGDFALAYKDIYDGCVGLLKKINADLKAADGSLL